jgi:hypothetical protein
MSGGVYNVMFSDITFDGRHNGFGVGSARVKTQRGRGGVVDSRACLILPAKASDVF